MEIHKIVGLDVKYYKILLFSLILLSIGGILSCKKIENLSKSKIRLLVHWLPDHTLDSTNVEYSDEANIIRGLYSMLMTIDSNGQLKASLGSSYKIDKNKVIFTIRKDVRTISGYQISSEDVYYSFTRLLYFNKNTHGKLEFYLDSEVLPKFPGDKCSGITIVNDSIIFNLKNEHFASFFIRVLASSDYAIIPKISIDQITFKINDYGNTSGPYYIAESLKEKVVLKKNKGHYLLSDDNPEIIELYTFDDSMKNVFKIVSENKVDGIPTFYLAPRDSVKKIQENLPNYNVYKTLNFSLNYMQFTERGLKKYSKNERAKIAALLKKEFLKEFYHFFAFDETFSYFPSIGSGSLDSDQENNLKKSLELNSSYKLPKDLRVKITAMHPEWAKDFLKKLNLTTDFARSGNEIYELSLEEQPDLFFAATDSGFYDDLTLLSYMQTNRSLGLTEAEFKEWIYNFVTLNSLYREKKLNELHYKMLSEMRVVPIGFSSYYAVTKRPWKVEAAKMYAGMPLWMIKQEQ